MKIRPYLLKQMLFGNNQRATVFHIKIYYTYLVDSYNSKNVKKNDYIQYTGYTETDYSTQVKLLLDN